MNTIDKTIKEVVSKLTTFDKMYQQMRIVDPIKKRVLSHEENHLIETKQSCYGIWNNNEICENCISMRAYNENDTFIKIEYTPNKIFMVTAIPVELNNIKVVVELLKDITKSMVIGNEHHNNNVEIIKLLRETNIAAITDVLTDLYNKRHILERLPVEILAHHFKNQPLSIIMADLDFFKKVNDTYGHFAGDYILKEFATVLKNTIRTEKDWASRFGGEEFLVCLPNTQKSTAISIAERIRKTVAAKPFTYKNQNIKLTSSFGVCTLENGNIKDYEELINCADQNLYKAKKNGRNRVIG